MIKSLNGIWNFIEDKESKLVYSDIRNRITNLDQKTIYVPSNWEKQGLNNFNGSLWYYRKFSFKEKQKLDYVLKFNGVDYFTDVWINDNYLGEHEGYFQSFYFPVSDYLNKSDDNLLVVRVTSPFEEPKTVWPLKKKLIKGIFNHHDCRPGGWSYEFGQDKNTGGIWNDVELHIIDKILIENIKINAKYNSVKNEAKIAVSIIYNNLSTAQIIRKIKLSIFNIKNNLIHFNYKEIKLKFGNNTDIIHLTLVNPDLWWSWDLGKPNLYKIKIEGNIGEVIEETFGIREVNLDDNEIFYLNDKSLFLRGTNIIPTQFLSELTKSKIEKMVKMMREANINIVRVHAHVNRKEFYDACDKYGIIVWQDFSLQWTYDDSEEFISNATSQIKDMIRLHFNHPSIAYWCCHNEPGEQIKTLDPFLYDAVLSEDNTRIIRMASNYEEHAYDGWYWGDLEHYAAVPMGPLVTEFGAQGIPELETLNRFIPLQKLKNPDWKLLEYHNFQYEQTFNIAKINYGNNINDFVKNSQDYQSKLINTAVDFYRREKYKRIAGVFQFMFIDCWESISWSVVDFYGKPKKAYYTLRKVYEPLYISVRVRQKVYEKSKKLNIDIWLINDLHKKYDNLSLQFSIDEKILGEIKSINILPDSVLYLDWEKFNIKLNSIRKGIKLIKVNLLSKRKQISSTEFNIEIK